MLRSLRDVVDWGLCIGCGACYHLCGKESVRLVNLKEVGIRPRYLDPSCLGDKQYLEVCPGYQVDAREGLPRYAGSCEEQILTGPTLEIWEGYAADPQIRYQASSGGLLTALSLYCLEKEKMAFVLHTGMDPKTPWLNRTVQSRNREQLLAAAGSRYAASSPCDGLEAIEASDRPCVFIGKPCDTAAVLRMLPLRPRLEERLGLVLTFFCAGTPSARGTLELLKELRVDPGQARTVRYRGEGWPGRFRVDSGIGPASLSYAQSWGRLQGHRPLRCQLCPDALGERADLACGDGWHRYREGSDDAGRSLVLIRTERGRRLLRAAMNEGYVRLEVCGLREVIAAQGIIRRRQQLFGRLLARRLLLLPIPRYKGFFLYRAWRRNPLGIQAKSILAGLRNTVTRGQWRRKRLFRRATTNPW